MKIALPLALLLSLSGLAVADDAAVLNCRALSDTASRLACYDAMPLSAAAPATAAQEERFGLKPAVRKAPQAPADTVRSTVACEIGGWSPGSRITLANGQVWRVVDGDAVLPLLRNPQAEVSRGVLGAYFLQIVGHTSAARVTRVQ